MIARIEIENGNSDLKKFHMMKNNQNNQKSRKLIHWINLQIE
jgi:hypothetical protein